MNTLLSYQWGTNEILIYLRPEWQARVCAELAKIETQQRAIVEHLGFLRKERCSSIRAKA